MAKEQAAVSDEMVNRIQAIGAVVQQATAVSEETQAASQEVALVTKKFESLIKSFNFKSSAGKSPA